MAFGSIFGTTATLDILLYLLRNGNTPVTKVQSDLGVSNDRFYGALGTLQELAYVSRDERTGRPTYVYLGLTSEGERIARILVPVAEALEASAGALGAEDDRLELAADPSTTLRRVALLRLLAEQESARSEWGRASEHASRQLVLARGVDDSKAQAEAHLVLGRIAQRRDDHAEAIQRLRDAVAMSDAESQIACEAEYLVGSSLLRLGRATEAAERFSALSSLAERSGDELWRARATEALGRVRIRQGLSAEAIPLLEQAAATYERLRADGDMPRTLVNRGTASYELNRPDALTWFEKAVEASRRVADVRMEAYGMSSAAAPLIERGEVRKAERYLRRARAIFDDLGERSAVGGVDLNLGNAYAGQGRWTDAEEAFDRALQVARETGKRALEANVHLNRGQTMKRRGLESEARGDLEEARRIFSEIENPARAARCEEELRDLNGRGTKSRTRRGTRSRGPPSPQRNRPPSR